MSDVPALNLPTEEQWQRQSAAMWMMSPFAFEVAGEYGRWLDEAHRRVSAVLGVERADQLMAEALHEAAREQSDVLSWARRWFAQLAIDAMYADVEDNQ